MGFFQNLKNKKYIKNLTKLADNGDNEARYTLAMEYLNGEKIEKDKIKANKYLKLAADDGHIPSKAYLKTKTVTDTIDSVVKVVDKFTKDIQK